MRTAFINTLCELAEQDERIWLLTGDLGYSVLEIFAERFPNRFVNIGVAEQNMMGVAAGLALCGKIIFVYSIANFPVMRCLEQLRNDVCYHNLNVKIVAVGGGFAYGTAGYTHHAVEDLAVMRSLPNMTVVAPADPVETRLAMQSIVQWPGPVFLRLGKANEPTIYVVEPDFQVGRAIVLREGTTLTLISTGAMLKTALAVADLLSDEGFSVMLMSLHTLKRLDDEAILRAARQTEWVFTIEEHARHGGLGSAVAEVIASSKGKCARWMPLGHKVLDGLVVGDQDWLRGRHALNSESLARTIKQILRSD